MTERLGLTTWPKAQGGKTGNPSLFFGKFPYSGSYRVMKLRIIDITRVNQE